MQIDLLVTLQIFQIIYLKHLNDLVLDCQDFLYPDRPLDFGIGTVVGSNMFWYAQIIQFSSHRLHDTLYLVSDDECLES